MGESERDRERARRQPFKIQFPGSEEANPASVIPCSRSKPPSIHPSLPPSPSSSLLFSLADSTLSLYSSVSNILTRCLSHRLTISPLNLSQSLSLSFPHLSLSPSLFLFLSDSTMPRPSHAYLTLADGRLGSMHTCHDQWLR